jgi:glycosyltransferase involved in cell wall biosynthesis
MTHHEKALARYPRVSVLIPCFHADDYIVEAVESVLAQNYPHIEILIAPDDQQTYSFLRERLKSIQLRILPPTRGNGTGAGNTRNHAIDFSTGDYFFCLDSDDTIESGLISAMMPLAREWGAAVCRTHYCDDHGQPLRTPHLPPKILSLSGYGQLLSSLRTLTARRLCPGYRNGFAQDILHDMHVIASMGGEIPVAPEGYYRLRVREGSASNSGPEKELRIQQRYDEIAHQAVATPTALGLQNLSLMLRHEIADAFRFRAFVSRRFYASGETRYTDFVRSREAQLYDEYRIDQHAAASDVGGTATPA